MKKNEVPQDNDGLHEGKFRDLCYAVDDKGNNVTLDSTGWEPKKEAMKQALEEIHIKVEEARQMVINGKKSILAYHMEKKIMAIKLLSQYTGIPRRKIKRHLRPDVFDKLGTDVLGRYAEAFNISMEELLDKKRLEEKI